MSCCNCLKIQILDDVTGVTAALQTGGKTYLDLGPTFSLEFFKSVEQFSIDEIDTEAVIEASIPQTQLNRALAYQIENKNKAGDVINGYNVLITEGTTTHRFSKMFFVGGGDAARSYSVRFEMGGNHWVKAAAQTYLNDFDFGSYRFTIDNYNTFNARTGYVDGEEGVVFPLVNYGRFANDNTIVLEDFRQHLFVTKVLDDGFCQLGWNFESPFFKSTAGRKLISYLNTKDYNTKESALDARKFAAGLNSQLEVFNNEIFDNGNNFEGGRFVGAGTHEFVIEISGNVEFPDQQDASSEIIVFIEKKNGERRIQRGFSSGNFSATIKGEFTINSGEWVRAGIEGNPVSLTVSNAIFYNNPKASGPVRGQEVVISDYLGRYPFLDFVKGCAHLINAKVVTDWVNKTVTLYSPFDVEYYDESIEGFYTDTVQDWTEKIVPKSEEISKRSIDLNRFQVYSFKRSTDNYIRELKLEEQLPLFAKRVDLGEDYQAGETTNANPFFEPTYNDSLRNYDFQDAPGQSAPVDIPFMLDNNNAELSFDIQPRILFWNGLSKQTSSDGATVKYWAFESSTGRAANDEVPYAFQKANSHVDDGVTIEIPELELTFGDHANSLYILFYERALQEQLFTSSHGFLAKIGSYEYNLTNFRNAYKAYYNGRTFIFNLLSINGRRSCSTSPVQITTRPRAYRGDVCGTEITAFIVNEAQIRVKYDDATSEISAERVNTNIRSPIVSDDLSVSTDDGVTFTPYTENDPITGSDEVIFRREVLFSDGSEGSTVEVVADRQTFCDNEINISIDYTQSTATVSASVNDVLSSTISTDTWTVSIDGATAVSYTPGTVLSSFTTLFFERTVTFTDFCDDITVQKSFQIDVDPCPNQPELVWNEISDGLFVFTIDETNVQSSIAFSDIQVYNPATDKWRAWNGSPFRGMTGTKARVRIIYTDNCPPTNLESVCPIGV
jgi:hypothetical protein